MAEIFSDTWSEVAQDNSANYPDGWQGGTTFPNIPPTGREMMAAIKREYNRSHPTLTTGGDGDLVTLTPTTALTAYVDGQIFAAKLNASLGAAGTATRTLNISGLGGKKIYFQELAGGVRQTVQSGGEAKAGQPVFFRYDASLDSGAGGFVIFSWLPRLTVIESISFSCMAESAVVTTGLKFTFRIPFIFTVTGVKASLKTPSTGGALNLRIQVAKNGTNILGGAGLLFDFNETTTTTSSFGYSLTGGAVSMAADSEITVTVLASDGTATGLKMTLTGYQG